MMRDNGKPADFGGGMGGTGSGVPTGKPVRREQYLHRFGSAAVLMTVAWVVAENGSERKEIRLFNWPGL